MINQLITFTTKLDREGFDIYTDSDHVNIEYCGSETNDKWLLIATTNTCFAAREYINRISEDKPVITNRMDLIGLPENNASDYYDTHDRPQE